MKASNTLKGMWVCQGQDIKPAHDTIAYYRKDSIAKCEESFRVKWDVLKRHYGWKCIHVNITFEPVTNPSNPIK